MRSTRWRPAASAGGRVSTSVIAPLPPPPGRPRPRRGRPGTPAPPPRGRCGCPRAGAGGCRENRPGHVRVYQRPLVVDADYEPVRVQFGLVPDLPVPPAVVGVGDDGGADLRGGEFGLPQVVRDGAGVRLPPAQLAQE